MREKSGLICNKYKECQILKKSNIDSKYLQIFFFFVFVLPLNKILTVVWEKVNKKDADELKGDYVLEYFILLNHF